VQCGKVRELLSPMTDHEVTREEFGQIEEHLNSCRECAFASSMIVGLKRLVGSWEGVPASEAFRDRVIEQVKREPSPARRPVWRLALYGGAAALGVLVPGLLVVLSLLGGDEKNSSRIAREGAGAEAPAVREPSPRAKTAGPPAAGASADPVAEVWIQERAVHIERPGSPPSLASPGDVLKAGHTIRCSKKGSAELARFAGFRMLIEGGAEFAFGDGKRHGELRSGRALFRGGPGARTLRVRCGTQLVELGSSDGLVEIERLAGGAVRVVVASGQAEVSLAVGKWSLGSGEMMELNPGGSARTLPGEAEPEELARLRRWGGQ
jgi:hypothetical protein